MNARPLRPVHSPTLRASMRATRDRLLWEAAHMKPEPINPRRKRVRL